MEIQDQKDQILRLITEKWDGTTPFVDFLHSNGLVDGDGRVNKYLTNEDVITRFTTYQPVVTA